jgi:hypothetical protein
MIYTQSVKNQSRGSLWQHAVKSLTSNRGNSRILAEKRMKALWNHVWNKVIQVGVDVSFSQNDIDKYFDGWAEFADSCYGTKNPNELRVAYFSGPEPENDLSELLKLGVRIENIWAFESDGKIYEEALSKARLEFPKLKIFPGSLADFFKTMHLTFDIIYLDFTASLVSPGWKTLGPLHGVFDEQAMSDLSVLIVNSCEPDNTPEICEYLAAYFCFQPMVEGTVYGQDNVVDNTGEFSNFQESASVHGYHLEDLQYIIKENISAVYSAFSTSYPLNYSNFISPTLRFLGNPILYRQLFSEKNKSNSVFGQLSDKSVFDNISQYIIGNINEDISIKGDRLLNVEGFPLWNFIETLQQCEGDFSKKWFDQFNRNQKEKFSILNAAQFREALTEAPEGYAGLLSNKIKEQIMRVNAALPEKNGYSFCDIPMPHLWLELALNQLGAPFHANIDNHRRWTYKAKVRRMHIDAFTFDRCRGLYDYLPMIDMYGDTFKKLLPQMGSGSI